MSIKSKYYDENDRFVIDEETGELIETTVIPDLEKINKIRIDEMLEQSDSIHDIDARALFIWCKITKEVNSRGQIRLLGAYRDEVTEGEILDDLTVAGYTLRALRLTHSYSGLLQRNRKKFITTWVELFDVIGCRNRGTQTKVKKFIIENSLIREYKVTNSTKSTELNRFVVNPFLHRKANYSSQLAVSLFYDFIKEGSNMSTYAIRLLQCWGLIPEESKGY